MSIKSKVSPVAVCPHIPMQDAEMMKLYIVNSGVYAGHIVMRVTEEVTVDLSCVELNGVWTRTDICAVEVRPAPEGYAITLTQE